MCECCCCCCCCMPILWDHSHPNYSPSQHDKPASHTVLFVPNQNSVSQELVMYIMYIYVSVVVAAAAAAVAACQFCGITAIQTIHHPGDMTTPRLPLESGHSLLPLYQVSVQYYTHKRSRYLDFSIPTLFWTSRIDLADSRGTLNFEHDVIV